MARWRRKSKLRPKSPARVKKTKRVRKARSHHHAELWGLGFVVVGLFLGSVLYAGWDGGPVGKSATDGVRAVVGAAAYLAPIGLVGVGGLMVGRSTLVDFRPFRVGLGVLAVGVLISLGSNHGGYAGEALGGTLEKLTGRTGAFLAGLAATIVGGLLLSGASAGAILRRTGHVVRRAAESRRARPERPRSPAPVVSAAAPLLAPSSTPVDAEHAWPDVVSAAEPVDTIGQF